MISVVEKVKMGEVCGDRCGIHERKLSEWTKRALSELEHRRTTTTTRSSHPWSAQEEEEEEGV
ncbi:hypothetical protein TIFTF001_021394 [Ficus carica]|uniref:Uncharacterized protein n=1 Tax=Ficus carica TaxID=3494 RepID=A0AA88ACM2_FICCA|nr:hypothetical protein TIFTF001_021394 [Ficus carica]